jgi:hypothetical protein
MFSLFFLSLLFYCVFFVFCVNDLTLFKFTVNKFLMFDQYFRGFFGGLRKSWEFFSVCKFSVFDFSEISSAFYFFLFISIPNNYH